VQWADAATLAALGTLPRQLTTHRILWMLAARTGDLAPAASTAVHRLEAASALKITLNPLDRTAVADVAEDLLGAVPDPSLLKALEGVRGQPFLLLELLRGLHQDRLVEVDSGIARLTGTRIPLRFVDSVNRQLSRRALDLTPRGDPGRGPLIAETLAYLMYAGKAAEAVKLMTAGADDLTDSAAEAEARLSLAHLSMQYSSADMVEQYQRALELPDVPGLLRVQLLSFLSLGLDLFGDVSGAERAARDAVDAAQASGDPVSEVVTMVPRAAQALARGDWRQAIDLISEALARQHATEGMAVRLSGYRTRGRRWPSSPSPA
jgi:hypothetical protein